MVHLRKVLNEEKIQNLRLRAPLCLPKSTSLKKTLEAMSAEQKGYAILLEDGKPVGIFTERDVLTRVATQKADLSAPIEKFMTPNPKVLKRIDSVADAIRLMSEGGCRHVPVLDDRGEVQGIVSVRDIIDYLAEHFPYEVYNLPPDPHQVMRAPEGA